MNEKESNNKVGPFVAADGLPAYSEETREDTASSAQLRLPLDIKSSNFLQLSRSNDWLRGSWIIDPAMPIPPSFLPPLKPEETEETRNNISLDITQRGSIHADIFVLSPTLDGSGISSSTLRQRIYIRGSTSNGNVLMKIIVSQHEVASSEVKRARWPMQITCSSAHGGASLFLPRSFHGPLSFKVLNGSVQYSKAVLPTITLFYDNNGVQSSFLGDFDSASIQKQSAGEWAGDSLSAEAHHGSIKIYFDDEDIPSPAPSGTKAAEPAKGLVERISDALVNIGL